ncbi:unnamed protein product [Symbiodinium sp. CCMP2592]|nr:unnamed protein product [Symbiodinium sp. CCMP2592]
MAVPLAELGRRHFVSQAALESVLQDLGHDDGTSRRSIKRARDEQVAVETDFGHLLSHIEVDVLEKKQVAKVSLPILNIRAFLAHLCKRPGTAAFFARKVHAFYISFFEYGPEARCQEEAWYCICLCRSQLVNKMVGGLSALTHAIVTMPDFAALPNGCLLTLPSGERLMFFARIDTFLADEGAIKLVFDIKGASGILPCGLCANVVGKTGVEQHDASGSLCTIACTDVRRFIFKTDDDIYQAHAQMEAMHGRCSQAQFEQMQKACGINFNMQGVIAKKSLPLVQTCMYDFMHIYFVHGLFHLETGMLLPQLYHAGCSPEAILDFMKSFTWPQSQQGIIKETLQCFQKKIEKSEGFKGSASQCLNCYPLLRAYVLSLAPGAISAEVKKACKSFLNLCLVLDMLMEGNRGQVLVPAELQRLITQHCQGFMETYGPESAIPKLHYSMHLPMMLAAKKTLVSCFTHERKHRAIKELANHLNNPGTWYEASMMKEGLGKLVMAMTSGPAFAMEAHLISPKLADENLLRVLAQTFGLAGAHNAQASSRVQAAPGQVCTKGDFVILKAGGVAEAWLFCRLGTGELLALLTEFEACGRNVFKRTAVTAQIRPRFTPALATTIASGLLPGSFLVQLGLSPSVGLRVFHRRTVLDPAQHVILTKGDTVFILPPGGVRPPSQLLPDMLRSTGGWRVPLDPPRGSLQVPFCLLTDSPPGTMSHAMLVEVPVHLIDTGDDLRAFLVGFLRGDLESFSVFRLAPRVRDLCLFGQACIDVLVVTERISRLPCPPRLWSPQQVPYVLDLRPILRGIGWRPGLDTGVFAMIWGLPGLRQMRAVLMGMAAILRELDALRQAATLLGGEWPYIPADSDDGSLRPGVLHDGAGSECTRHLHGANQPAGYVRRGYGTGPRGVSLVACMDLLHLDGRLFAADVPQYCGRYALFRLAQRAGPRPKALAWIAQLHRSVSGVDTFGTSVDFGATDAFASCRRSRCSEAQVCPFKARIPHRPPAQCDN